MFDRGGGQRSTKSRRVTRDVSFNGPNKGLIKSQRTGSGPDGAADFLLNIFPTTEGGRCRGGSLTKATLPAGVKHLCTFEAATSKLFGATDTAIYDVTAPASPTIPPAASVTGLTSGDWTSQQFVSAGASYLVMVNGADSMRQFDGTSWLAITAVSTPAITGLATSALSHVWTFKRRMWFVQKGTMSAWYLPVLSRAGVLTEFPLGSVFKLGGELLFGATWSLDSGSGLSEVCVFFSSKGEAAVYQGIDPGSDMTLQGVYKMGVPLHKNEWFSAGGDLAIATEDGISAISTAVRTDQSGLFAKAITAPIFEQWASMVKSRLPGSSKFNCKLWSSASLLVVGLPKLTGTDSKALVSNAVTGAWGMVTGWDMSCTVVFKNDFYFGTSEGRIKQADVTGFDDGAPYHCVYLPSFNRFGRNNEKTMVHARCVARTNQSYTLQLFGNTDFQQNIPTPLPVDLLTDSTTWDTAIWNNPASVWGSDENVKAVQSAWQTITGVGTALSAGVSFLSGNLEKPDLEFLRIDMVYEDGQVMG